ncbi:MAG: adenylate/guanylate cyclase domain-containing protein [Planctomycetota bacterium]|jgi:class 3 adenylate cyclase
MSGNEETVFEGLLRERGTAVQGDPQIERDILEKYQDDCAVLVLDSVGFTKATQENGIIHFLSLVVAMRDAVRPILEKHDAYTHWAAADNMYAVFPTAKAAVSCAVEIRNIIREENAKRDERARLDICIGIGAGRMLRIGRENIYGDQMNIASKLGEDTAGPGEILISEAAFAEIGDTLSDLKTKSYGTRQGGVDIPYVKVLA